MIGMLCKELLNLGTVRVDLALEHAQHSHTRQSQATLGTGKGLAGDEPGGMRKDFHPLFIGLRSRQTLSMEELLPLSFASRYQSLRGGESFQEGPCARPCPVFKGLQSRWVIFAQGALELIDERGALLNKGDLVAAEQTQLGHQRTSLASAFQPWPSTRKASARLQASTWSVLLP